MTAASFIGEPAEPQQLYPKFRFLPDVVGLHYDSGNTRTQDWDTPLGKSPGVLSRSVPVLDQYWQDEDHLIARMVCNGTQPFFCMAALDLESLETLATWAPENQTLFTPYGQVFNDSMTFSTLEGHIFRVQRVDGENGTYFRQTRDVGLSAVLPSGHALLCNAYDADGNLWFSALPIPDTGTTNSSIVGYVEPSGAVHTTTIENQVVENAMAINNKTAYINTGPIGADDHANATGYMFAFQANGSNGIHTVWSEAYSAGSGMKPGGFSRGSGSSPSLIGNQFVAITDNADGQVNLVVYKQAEEYKENNPNGASSFVCQIPLFQPNASANENTIVSHFDGSIYSVAMNNNYGAPSLQGTVTEANINGAFNDFTSLAPGINRVDITKDGNCSLSWALPIRTTSVLSLSTSNGLLYAYTQDDQLALNGEYVWYFTAVNFTTGGIVWRTEAGQGGSYNNNFAQTQLAPNGALYQSVLGGIAWLKDGA